MKIVEFIKGVIHRMLSFRTIQDAEHLDSPLSQEMIDALQKWHDMYTNQADWLSSEVKSMNLSAFICGEIARQILLEMRWTITGKTETSSPRAEYLSEEFTRLMTSLRQKLEVGCASGGMIIKPYRVGEHLYFDYTMDWDIYPLAFDGEDNLCDVILPDSFTDGRYFYTRLERHTVEGTDVRITNKAYKSSDRSVLGKEIPLSAIEHWADLAPEALVKNSNGPLFGRYRVAIANVVDPSSPIGASVFSKACDTIREADEQYSRLLWEFEGSELAVDIDPTALRSSKSGDPCKLPKHAERLFRKLDLTRAPGEELYEVFSPQIRDASLLAGLNRILKLAEDLCGLSRGTLSDAEMEEKTATELKIGKQRTFDTISDNQAALERALRDVVRVMDFYATLYDLAPAGDYEISIEWGDSVLTDTSQELSERLMLFNAGVIGKAEMRQWYFGESEEQAKAAIDLIEQEKSKDFDMTFKPRDD